MTPFHRIKKKGVFDLKLREEMSHDLNFRQPRVIADDKLTIIENVTAIVMISETSPYLPVKSLSLSEAAALS